MKNRLLELCMCKKLNTVDDVVKELGINKNECVALLNCDNSVIIKEETISKCLSYFNVSYDYFTCIVD
jgi:hypothetical protein